MWGRRCPATYPQNREEIPHSGLEKALRTTYLFFHFRWIFDFNSPLRAAALRKEAVYGYSVYFIACLLRFPSTGITMIKARLSSYKQRRYGYIIRRFASFLAAFPTPPRTIVQESTWRARGEGDWPIRFPYASSGSAEARVSSESTSANPVGVRRRVSLLRRSDNDDGPVEGHASARIILSLVVFRKTRDVHRPS